MADVLDAVRPVLVVSQGLGLAPVSIGEDRTLTTSKTGFVYTSLISAAYGGGSGYLLYSLLFGERNVKQGMYISEANKICQMACGVGVMMITLLLSLIQRNKMVAVVHNIRQINIDMVKLKLSIDYAKVTKFCLCETIALYFFLIVLMAHDLVIHYNHGLDDAEEVGTWLCQFLSNIYNFTMESQFVLGALLLKKHFTVLNDYLAGFNNVEDSILSKGLDNDSYVDGLEAFLGPKLLDPKLIAWDGNFARLQTSKRAVSSEKEKETKLSKIKIFRKLHSNLCDVKETLNTAYSLQLLASVAQAFVIITSDLYMLFTTISDPTTAQVGFLIYPIVWSITHILELIFVVVTCTRTSKKANQTAVIVHKLLARDCDQDVRNQLKLFSIQLLHRKISFSACGFFTLDMTLLQAIIGAATTYLVILIQFHNTYERPTAKPPT